MAKILSVGWKATALISSSFETLKWLIEVGNEGSFIEIISTMPSELQERAMR